jgi:uncharacterized protein YcfJ
MKRTATALLLSVLLISSGMAGCASQKHARYTATGAGIGAVTGGILGGVIGSMSGRSAEGVVIGSILGGLMGASVGDAQYQQQRSYEAAAEHYDYNREKARRDLVRIEDASSNPKVVHPGEEVTLSVTYTVLSRWKDNAEVHEVREIRKEGDLIGRPEVTVERQGGTWSSSMPIRLPDNAEAGTYVVTNIVETEDAGDVRESTFRVEPGGSWRR